jgi:hypothetical protein
MTREDRKTAPWGLRRRHVICAGVAGITHRAELTHVPASPNGFAPMSSGTLRPANQRAATRTRAEAM